MAKRRTAIEYQLQIAKRKIEKYETQLKDHKVDQKRFRNDPHWRHLTSKLSQLQRQLKSVEVKESFKK